MATAKEQPKKKKRRAKKNKSQLSFKMGLNDERIPKIWGLLLLLVSLYLFIAFVSYLFTWQEDYDEVARFSWEIFLYNNLEIENWLGRLGAFLSHSFFMIFGLSSFLVAAMLGLTGYCKLNRVPLAKFGRFFRWSFLLLIWCSLFLGFIFRYSDFPWGGAFGSEVGKWMGNFLGMIGMIAFFLFTFVIALVWVFNPNFNEWTYNKISYEIGNFIEGLIPGRKKRRAAPEMENVVEDEPLETLRPRERPKIPKPKPELSLETEMPKPDVEFQNEDLKEGQLAFNLDKNKKKGKAETLKTGEGELEISETEKTKEPALSIQEENKTHLDPYDPTLDLGSYENPVVQLLESYEDQKVEIDRAELELNKDQIIETLLNYKIEIVKIKATIGPTVTLYEIVPAPGVRISKIKNLEDDIALSLAALGIRIIAPIPGKGTIGIEVPNKSKQIVSLKEVLLSEKFKKAKMDLPIAMGKTISNEVFVADLAKMLDHCGCHGSW